MYLISLTLPIVAITNIFYIYFYNYYFHSALTKRTKKRTIHSNLKNAEEGKKDRMTLDLRARLLDTTIFKCIRHTVWSNGSSENEPGLKLMFCVVFTVTQFCPNRNQNDQSLHSLPPIRNGNSKIKCKDI